MVSFSVHSLSLHDALPISLRWPPFSAIQKDSISASRSVLRRASVLTKRIFTRASARGPVQRRSEEHTSELQSHVNLVCRLLLEKIKPINPLNQPDAAGRPE